MRILLEALLVDAVVDADTAWSEWAFVLANMARGVKVPAPDGAPKPLDGWAVRVNHAL
jgi:hypothetical protein